jgi:hypothetical protein
VGRLITGGFFGTSRTCTAALLGRRHIITASSCAIWRSYTDDSPPEPMVFQPGYNMGSMYSDSNVIQTLWNRKVPPEPWKSGSSWQRGDWLIGILDRDMQATNGWFGQLQYDSAFNGQVWWEMLSYPQDYDSSSRAQVVQGPMAVNVVAGKGTPEETYFMDGLVQGGDIGSPVYGWYKNAYRLIGIVGAQNTYPLSFVVGVQGGSGLWSLIAEALEKFP